MKIILVNGCFDVLHAGHVRHLREAREMGTYLHVALTIDECVNKGPHRPINTWEDRACVLHELECVDRVVPSRNSWDAIRSEKPQIFVKGCDYNLYTIPKEDLIACAEIGSEIRFTTAPKMSSTEIMARMRDSVIEECAIELDRLEDEGCSPHTMVPEIRALKGRK